jgi:cobalt transporter subunit CbtA
MIFRRIIYSALIIGCLAGLLLSAAQIMTVNPILFAAEAFESSGHDHGSHDHGDSWSPEDGAERTSFTIFANISAGIGFAAILLSLMSQLQIQGIARLSLSKGFLWGMAGFTAVFLAPAIGLPPEIPGIQAAALEKRQLWWTLAVVAVGLGLLVLSFAPVKYKVIGIIGMAIP